MHAKVLFVDDDKNILAAYAQHLPAEYAVDTALGGAQALLAMERQGPYAVVVADLRLADMSGTEFLERARALCPDTMRIVLTANADQRTAQQAVNQGHIFRFLTKPCPFEELTLALEEGVRQNTLVRTERDLLEQTLAGAIKVLTEMLSTADPVSFGVAALAADLAEEVGRRLGLEATWSLRTATMLAPIGLVTLPPSILARDRRGDPLTPKELELLQRIPEVGARLLAPIPRLEEVGRFLQYQAKHFDGSGFPKDALRGAQIPVQSRILEAVTDFMRIRCQRSTPAMALERMERCPGRYDPAVLDILSDLLLGEADGAGELPAIREVGLGELRVGQILAEPVASLDGVEVLPKGTPLSFSHLEKVQNHARLMGVREPIQVFEIG